MKAKLTPAEREAIKQRNIAAIDKIMAERVARGRCRHCDGPVPCWSPFGDKAPGVRYKRFKLPR